MPSLTKEQLTAAKAVDLLTYLQASEPGELKKTSAKEYRTVTHGSLVISNGCWYWNRGGFGGRSALDYLIKVRELGFLEAAGAVLGSRAVPILPALPAERRPPPQKKLLLPPSVSLPDKAVKYLQRRGIHSEIIGQCLNSGILYEGVYENPKDPEHYGAAVCVFLGKDDAGRNRFATLRSVSGELKRDAPGSDKRFSFRLPAGDSESRELAVFEAPLDLLSHATLARRGGLDFDGHRLSLGGISEAALTAFLERHPRIERVSLCLDADAAGREAVGKIAAALAADKRFARIAVRADPPAQGKDYNDLLCQTLLAEREWRRERQKSEAAASL